MEKLEWKEINEWAFDAIKSLDAEVKEWALEALKEIDEK